MDKKKVHEAIEKAETSTTARIFVSIAPYFWGNVLRTAEFALRKHARKHAGECNTVLLFLVPSRRHFALVGDADVHEKLGQHTWDAIAKTMQERLRDGDPTAALIQAIEELGRELARHFPRTP